MNVDPSVELAEPSTSAERLHQIAAARPDLGHLIIVHPNCYPELRDWLTAQQPLSPGVTQTAVRAKKPRSVGKLIGTVAAVVLPLITIASVGIPLLANMNERESSADTLNVADRSSSSRTPGEKTALGEISVEAHSGIDWLVRADAPIETFPLDAPESDSGTYTVCSPAQFEWLEKYAEPADLHHDPSASFDVVLHNSSTTGASMPIGNIRFVGEEVESVPLVTFQCPTGGRGAHPGGQPLLIRVTGEEALYGEPLDVTGDDVQPVGSPVTLNLAPGEVSTLTLTRDESVDKQRRYEGQFIADLLDGSNEQLVLADEVVFRRAPVAGFYIGYESGMMSNVFECGSPTFSTEFGPTGRPIPRPCTLAEAAVVMQEAAEAVQ